MGPGTQCRQSTATLPGHTPAARARTGSTTLTTIAALPFGPRHPRSAGYAPAIVVEICHSRRIDDPPYDARRTLRGPKPSVLTRLRAEGLDRLSLHHVVAMMLPGDPICTTLRPWEPALVDTTPTARVT
jgi:hypothetical protein